MYSREQIHRERLLSVFELLGLYTPHDDFQPRRRNGGRGGAKLKRHLKKGGTRLKGKLRKYGKNNGRDGMGSQYRVPLSRVGKARQQQLRAAKKERRKRKEGRQEKRERGRRHAIAAENEGPVERWKDSVALMYEKQMLRKKSGGNDGDFLGRRRSSSSGQNSNKLYPPALRKYSTIEEDDTSQWLLQGRNSPAVEKESKIYPIRMRKYSTTTNQNKPGPLERRKSSSMLNQTKPCPIEKRKSSSIVMQNKPYSLERRKSSAIINQAKPFSLERRKSSTMINQNKPCPFERRKSSTMIKQNKPDKSQRRRSSETNQRRRSSVKQQKPESCYSLESTYGNSDFNEMSTVDKILLLRVAHRAQERRRALQKEANEKTKRIAITKHKLIRGAANNSCHTVNNEAVNPDDNVRGKRFRNCRGKDICRIVSSKGLYSVDRSSAPAQQQHQQERQEVVIEGTYVELVLVLRSGVAARKKRSYGFPSG